MRVMTPVNHEAERGNVRAPREGRVQIN